MLVELPPDAAQVCYPIKRAGSIAREGSHVLVFAAIGCPVRHEGQVVQFVVAGTEFGGVEQHSGHRSVEREDHPVVHLRGGRVTIYAAKGQEHVLVFRTDITATPVHL